MYAVLLRLYVGFLNARLLHYACWQLHCCEKRIHQRPRCDSASRNHFSMQKEHAVHESAVEDILPVAFDGEIFPPTKTTPVLHVKPFVLLRKESPPRLWQVLETL